MILLFRGTLIRSKTGRRKIYSGYSIHAEEDAMVYDAVYIEEGASAMADFLDSQKVDKKTKWELLKDKIYIGVNGYLADLWYSNGECRVHIAVDIWNKQYAVIEVV